MIAFVFYGIWILSRELFRNILSINHITYMRTFYILLYFLGHILRSNIFRYYYSIVDLHQLSSLASRYHFAVGEVGRPNEGKGKTCLSIIDSLF